ncbi:Hsp70 family protein [Nocardioides caldifontis]|uniref:Hsp70 family protein n=1 Tax=Nocardioides caldifontis TaxID=2588938 RepID=UPI0011E03BDB|nr:Hsp70 family protein [Nocardioides caldifontis]
MGYRLGIDLGTTFTAAATDDGSGPRMVGLGNRALQVPSVLFLAEDGTWLCGEAAERRSATEPGRVVREFKRRLGDTVPVLVGGQPFSPQALTATLLRWVVATASERQGGGPGEVVLTRPANWGGFKQELFAQVGTLADLPAVVTCTEPEAAATQYASRAPLEPGARVVVYDLGGGTFDVCVLERREVGFGIVGTPDGVEHLGGIDFDEAVFRHVLGLLGDRVAGLDPEEPEVTAGLTRLRRDCVEAKEALSNDVDAVVPVALPGVTTSVRLTRTELEELISPALRETLAATQRALRSSGTTGDQLAAAVLVGGSSRIPLVSQLLQSELGVRTAMDTHPKHDIALGAVQYQATAGAAPAPAPSAAPAPTTSWPTRDAGRTATAAAAPVAPTAPVAAPARAVSESATAELPRTAPSTPPPVAHPPPPAPGGGGGPPWLRGRLPWVAGAGALAVVVVVAALWWALRDTEESGGGTTEGGGTEETVEALPESTLVVPLDLGDGVRLYAVGDGTRDPLTEAGVAPDLPSLSPDRRLVYFRSGDSRDAWRMEVLELASGEVVPAVPEDPPGASCVNRPAWDPGTEGRVLVLCRLGEGPERQVFQGTAGEDGVITGLTPMTGLDQVELGNPSFTGTGALAVTFGPNHEAPGVHVFRDPTPADPGEEVALTSGQAEDTVGSPVDGRILYRSDGTLRMVADDGTAESLGCPTEPEPDPVTQVPTCLLVTPDSGVARDPSWSPDGSRVVFELAADEDAETGQLMVLELAPGAQPEPFSDAIGEVSGPAAWASR